MAETANSPATSAATPAAANGPIFQIQRVYLKESSLEQPNSPAILLVQEQPTVDIQLAVNAENAAEGVFEVSVTATVHTKIKDKTVFLAEVKQAGIFEIRNLDQAQLNQVADGHEKQQQLSHDECGDRKNSNFVVRIYIDERSA